MGIGDTDETTDKMTELTSDVTGWLSRLPDTDHDEGESTSMYMDGANEEW